MVGYIASIAVNSRIVLEASTVSTSFMMVWPVSRSIAPWMFMSLPLGLTRGVAPAALFHCDRHLLRRPATNWAHRVGGMHRISEDHRFIGGKVVQLVLIRLDERCLFRRVQLARDRFRFAVLHAQAVQQRDQPGSGLVFNTAFTRDPRANRAGRAWQGFGDPGFQLVLLLHRQTATAPFMAEARQSLNPVFLIKLVPGSDRVVVEQQRLSDRLTAHASVQQHQRVGAARQAVRGRTVAGQLNQVDARAAVQEARADHGSSRIASADVGKQFFRISGESGYIPLASSDGEP
jgi:hypothetical protein